jgi:multidrug resistance efflux pump
LVAGLALLAVGAYVVIGEHLAGVSDNASVNARLLVVRAPIDGLLTLRVRTIGARVADNESLGEITDVRAELGRLAELKRTEVSLRADVARIEKQRTLVAKAQRTFAAYAEDYRQGRIRQLEARLGEARAVTEAAQARLRESASAMQRATALSERGVQTAANLERAKASFEVATEDLKVTKEKATYLGVELEAAKSGTFLGDSYNDAPYSLQRARELDLRLAEMDSEMDHVLQRLREVEDQVVSEQQQISRRTTAEIQAPTAGVAWDFMASSGEVVRKGQDLLRLVDCTSAMITAGVGERLYNSLKPGDKAQFRLRGDQRVFEATITRLAGSGAASRYENFAVGPSPYHLKQYDVTLVSPDLLLNQEVGCSVGRTGRVVFSPSALNIFYLIRTQLGM